MIYVDCTKCGMSLRVEESWAGKVATCPECRGRFQIGGIPKKRQEPSSRQLEPMRSRSESPPPSREPRSDDRYYEDDYDQSRTRRERDDHRRDEYERSRSRRDRDDYDDYDRPRRSPYDGYGYDDYEDDYDEFETPEERQKREKRARKEAQWSKVATGLTFLLVGGIFIPVMYLAAQAMYIWLFSGQLKLLALMVGVVLTLAFFVMVFLAIGGAFCLAAPKKTEANPMMVRMLVVLGSSVVVLPLVEFILSLVFSSTLDNLNLLLTDANVLMGFVGYLTIREFIIEVVFLVGLFFYLEYLALVAEHVAESELARLADGMFKYALGAAIARIAVFPFLIVPGIGLLVGGIVGNILFVVMLIIILQNIMLLARLRSAIVNKKLR